MIQWFEFDNAEAKGRVGVEPGEYGLWIYVGDEEHCVVLVDLFHMTDLAIQQNVLGTKTFGPHAQLVLQTENDPLGFVKFLPQGSRLFLETGVKALHGEWHDAIYGVPYGYEEE